MNLSSISMSMLVVAASTLSHVSNRIQDPKSIAGSVIQVSGGAATTCAILDTRTAKCWGWNGLGQLGDGTTIDRKVPTDVVGVTGGIAAIDTLNNHTCAVTNADNIKCWGWNTYGQLGDGTQTSRVTPVDVIDLLGAATSVTTGGWHTCALMSDGGASCWGWNGSGQLGDSTTNLHRTPSKVTGITSRIVSLAAGWHHNCALISTGAVMCWGQNLYGQVGDRTTLDRAVPATVFGLTNGVRAIATLGFHSCALTSAGAVKCWGLNDHGQLGNGTKSNSSTPVDVVGLNSGVISITTGEFHTCALMASGVTMCWGLNDFGQVGDGTLLDRSTPVRVVNLGADVVVVEGGDKYTCAQPEVGSLKCWGQNHHGQLGDGTTISRNSPVNVVGIGNEATSDAELSYIEVTQVVQNAAGTVPMVAGKPTYVRAYVRCQSSCSRATGKLHAYDSVGLELTGSPIDPVNASIVPEQQTDWTQQRGDLAKSLNFILPITWVQGKVALRLELPGRELSGPRDVTFIPIQTVRVGMTRVQKIGEREQGVKALVLGHTWASALFPFRFEPVVLAAGIYMPSSLAHSEPLVLRSLELQKTLYNLYYSRDGSQRIDKIYGWMPDSYFSERLRGGASPQVPNVAFGEDVEAYGIGGIIFAHEMAHTFGILHPNKTVSVDPITDPPCGAPGNYEDPHWPSPDARINDWGIDGLGTGFLVPPSSGLKGPTDYYDVMSYCWGAEPFLGKVWISPYTYSGLASAFTVQSTLSVADTSATALLTYAIASGIVFSNGTATLDPIIGIPSVVALPLSTQTGDYCLETHNISSVMIDKSCFDLAFVGHAANSVSNTDGFVKTLPLSDSVMKVVLTKNGTVLTTRLRSASLPMFGGVPTTANGIVSWSASDNDGDPLVFTVLYSSNGSSWLPIAANIGDTHYLLPVNELPGGQNARVRILASDGINTSAIDSVEFVVSRKPPIAYIETAQASNNIKQLWIGPFVLQGGAYDYEDGALKGGNIRWSSSVDGSLGVGEVIITKLSRGPHVITLSATDSDENITNASIDINLGSLTWLPLARR